MLLIISLLILFCCGLAPNLNAYRFTNPYATNPKLHSDVRRITPYGEIRYFAFWDSRQPIGYMDRNAQLGPLPSLKASDDNRDINARGRLNADSILTVFGVAATGFDVLGAKASGVLDVDFFSNKNEILNTPRMRTGIAMLN